MAYLPSPLSKLSMTIASADLLQLMSFIARLYEPSTQSFIERPEVVRELGALLHADFIGHAVWDPVSGNFEQATQWGRDAQIAHDYENYFQRLDPMWPLQQGLCKPTPSDALMDRKSFHNTEYFCDFLSKHRIYSSVDFFLHDAGPVKFDYRFATSDPRKCFGDREVALLNILRPHLVNEYQLRLVARSRRWPELTECSYPSFIVRPSAKPEPNRNALALLSGLEAHDRDVLHQLLVSVSLGASWPYQWNGFNVCVERTHEENSGQGLCRVHLLAGTVGSAAWLQQRFSLTQREGEVCHLLLKGMADKQIAKKLSISYWTVRIHVGKILEKLEVDSRSAVGIAVLKASHGVEPPSLGVCE
ncbi:helix-turn-helix transcriptional regulator [Trinickia symbiotica]|uniref:Helix-turn-helix transcriptional regulator n=1 Tax=Trinickia symbiotica TaxID=863227 RepID=A0A2T3XLN9_9BURK|nr:helix-turn-helix transcriptional regulator [Trinickia symbiotica]PTB17430.1 helix-turn-helix transcriptional regulator [Trinickia symbiotica]